MFVYFVLHIIKVPLLQITQILYKLMLVHMYICIAKIQNMFCSYINEIHFILFVHKGI